MKEEISQDCLALDDLQQLITTKPSDIMLIDVRSAEEYAEDHVDGAVHIPVDSIINHIGEIDGCKTIITICWKGGGRSAKASEILKDLGYKNVYYLCNGTLGWLELLKKTNN